MLARDELLKILGRIGRPQPAALFESEVLDFKQPGRSDKETLSILADASVCFSNANGGTIVVGINDRATSRDEAFVGTAPSLSLDAIRKGIFDRTSPNLTTIAWELEEEGTRLVVIDVPPGILPHSNNAGLATRRLGKECRPFTPDQQREVLAARGHVDWSAEPTSITPAELSDVEVDRLRRVLLEGGRSELASQRKSTLLQSLRLIAAEGSMTRAAVLLLGTEDAIAAVAPDYGYSYQYRPTAGSEATSRLRQSRPLLAAITTVLEAVEARLQVRPLNLAGGVQLQLVDYPMDAVRELVVNAFIHRSYDVTGTVEVEHTPERLTVTSPGRLVAGVTPENILTHPPTPRHRLLADVVSSVRLAERTGQGVDRAYREMLRSGKEPPTFDDSDFITRVVLPGGIGNDSFVRFVSDLPTELASDVEVLLVLSVLRTRASLDAKRLAARIQRSPAEAQDVLERLAADEVAVLEPTRSTLRRRFPTYRLRSEPLSLLSRAVSYRRRTVDETDQKVVDHVREYGFVTNKTLQRMFDVNLYTARNLLVDLQARGLLRKLGKARGGPGVRYGPGRRFPK